MVLRGEESMKKRTHISPQDVVNYNSNSAGSSQSFMSDQNGTAGLNGVGKSGLTSQENRNTGWGDIHSSNNTPPYWGNISNSRTNRTARDLLSRIGSVLLLILAVVFVIGLIVGFVQNREAIGITIGAAITNFAYGLAAILIKTAIIWWLINCFARWIKMDFLITKRNHELFALIFMIFVIGIIIPELGASLSSACVILGFIVLLIKLFIG